MPYKDTEDFPDVWSSIRDAFALGKIETMALLASMDAMDSAAAGKGLPPGFDDAMRTYTRQSRPLNIFTFPVILSVLVDGIQRHDSVYAVLTRHQVTKSGTP